MPAVRRRLFNAIAVVSLLLCLASLPAWVRSRRTGDQIALTRYRQSKGIITSVDFGFAHGGGDFGLFYVEIAPSFSVRRWDYIRGPAVSLHQVISGRVTGLLGYGWYSYSFASPAAKGTSG